MAKGSRRLLLAFLFFTLLYAALLRCRISPLNLWRYQLSHWQSHLSVTLTLGTERNEHTRFLLRRLVRGKARRELSQNAIACISDLESDICVTTDAVRIATATPASPATIYLTAGQRLTHSTKIGLRPYPRKTDSLAMERTSSISLVDMATHRPPSCDVTHNAAAVVFSTGGFAGNFFHDISDIIIPLYLTSSHLRTRVHLVITDFEPWWVRKYHRILTNLTSSDIVVGSSNSVPVDGKVHCFPAAVVGLKYHGNLACNSSDTPGGISVQDFRRFLHTSLSLSSQSVAATEDPVLVLLSRRRSRMLLNEEEVVELARGLGFQVVLATPNRMSEVEEFAELVNGCSVLMGVHGAGLTNMVFLRPGAVLLQVVPLGLDWASAVYYGRPAVQMGLQYVEYHAAVEESTLYGEYPKDHPILTDPWSINLQGYNVSRPLYTDGQNVTLHLPRFRDSLLQAQQLLPRASQR